MELKTIEDVVTDCLKTNVESQKNDFILYADVLDKLGIDSTYFRKFINGNMGRIPSFESVTRCRRKAQEKNNDLKDAHISLFRKNVKEPEYVEYSRSR